MLTKAVAKTPAHAASFSLILLFTLLSSCGIPAGNDRSRNEPQGDGNEVPTRLRIASADNIRVTRYSTNRDTVSVIQGVKVAEVIKAISSGKRIIPTDNIPSWILEFYKGTNYLDCVAFEGNLFNCDYSEQYGKDPRKQYFDGPYTQYSDDKKVFENLDTELARQVRAQQGR